MRASGQRLLIAATHVPACSVSIGTHINSDGSSLFSSFLLHHRHRSSSLSPTPFPTPSVSPPSCPYLPSSMRLQHSQNAPFLALLHNALYLPPSPPPSLPSSLPPYHAFGAAPRKVPRRVCSGRLWLASWHRTCRGWRAFIIVGGLWEVIER